MGQGAEAAAAALRCAGVRAEALPVPDRESVRIGRRYTSGKECVPMCITLGSLLQRLEADRDSQERFAFLMPTTAGGPCRFGVYNLLHKIVLERLGWSDRVRVWSPADRDYFDGVMPGLEALIYAGFIAMDTLVEAFHEVAPVESRPGAASAIFERHRARLLATLERYPADHLTLLGMFTEVASGRLFGCAAVVEQAAEELAAVREDREVPTVLVTGEIYVRLDQFANDDIVGKLRRRGIRGRLVLVSEWLQYTDHLAFKSRERRGFLPHISNLVKARIRSRLRALANRHLDLPPPTRIEEALDAAAPYVREDLWGEAVLTVGGPLHEWHAGLIDGVVSVGPLECMPNKIAEAQLFHVEEHEGLASMTVPLNGDPIDPEVIDGFAFEVHARFRQRQTVPSVHRA
jgi:predicted nucleotide-binding protein (sugar kinase/HSP70/actin superfamily)